jgi:hypothetical protein
MPLRLYENYTVADRQQLIRERDKQEKEQIVSIVKDGLREAGLVSVWEL